MQRDRVLKPAWSKPSPRARAERAARINAARDPVITAMYRSRAWGRVRAQVLAEQPICATAYCNQATKHVDHITPHRGQAWLFFLRSNLQGLCTRCHSRKTARYDGGFGNTKGEHRGE